MEILGLVAGIQTNRLSLLLPEGELEVELPESAQAELEPFKKTVIRIRGALFATWNSETHELQSRSILLHNATISVDKPAPADPFDAPEKTPRGFFRFDVKATPFQLVKVRGQVTYADAHRLFLEEEDGIQVLPATRASWKTGDWVEAVGYPEISGSGPLLRQAQLRKIRDGVLPEPKLLPATNSSAGRFACSRVRLEGILAAAHTEEDGIVLQIQSRERLFLTRVANPAARPDWRPGSELSVTGILVAAGQSSSEPSDISRFALLVNSPSDVSILSIPSWWTLGRLVTAVGMLMVILALAAVWISVLRRQVAQRTLELRHEIHEREAAERERSLEAERSRIARDLHDDLGASLTEISVLASTGQQAGTREQPAGTLFQAITGKAKELVSALDIIVWALNPADNSLQLACDYLCDFAKDYLSSSGIACRYFVPLTLPPIICDGQRWHRTIPRGQGDIEQHSPACGGDRGRVPNGLRERRT